MYFNRLLIVILLLTAAPTYPASGGFHKNKKDWIGIGIGISGKTGQLILVLRKQDLPFHSSMDWQTLTEKICIHNLLTQIS